MMKHVSVSDFLRAFEKAEVWSLWHDHTTHSMKLSVMEDGKEIIYKSPDLLCMSSDEDKVFKQAMQKIINRKDGQQHDEQPEATSG